MTAASVPRSKLLKGKLHKIREDLGIPEDDPTPVGRELQVLERRLSQGSFPFQKELVEDGIDRLESLLEAHRRFEEEYGAP